MVKLSKKMMAGSVLTILLITIAALPYNTQPVEAEPSNIIATYGKGYLQNITGLLVLHVKGTPYEMGYQHGFLLKDRVQTIAQHVVQQMMNMGYSYEYMISCAQTMEPHIPQEYIEEMEGLADGASINYTDVFLTQIQNSIQYYGHGWTGCSGFVVYGNATSDGHLCHGRSVDVSLCTVGSIGLVTVYEPENGNTFVNVGQIGIIAVHTGMNREGITVEDNLSHSTNKTLDGMPVNFILRKVLQYSNNLTHAIDIISQADRTQGYNILLGDGRNLDGAAVEVSHDYCKVFWAGDPAENITPHYPIPNTVRRTNHYVDPELAATQRSPYAPIVGFGQSWDRYELLSQLIEGNYGNIDAQMSIEFLRTPPVAWATINLQSVVFDSTNMELWVADSAFNTPAYSRDFIYVSHDDLFPEYTLTISSTAGGNVVTPGVGNFTYDEGTVVNLVAMPNTSYRFVHWTGDVDTIANLSAATTNITMSGNYTITAEFEESSGVGCFIATAAYGSPMAKHVQTLRKFRDEYLLTNSLGQAFIDLYYKLSPPMADFITNHHRLKPIVRGLLVPAVAVSTILVNAAPAEKTAIMSLLILLSVALAIWGMGRPGSTNDSHLT